MPNTPISEQRLHNQHITAPSLTRAADVVQWLVAVQAQDFAGAKWGLGLRMVGATDTNVEQAFTDGAVLRTHLLRPTWHFVAPADIRWLLALTAPRVHAANALYYRKVGLDADLTRRTQDALIQALQGNKQLTRDELRDVLAAAGIDGSVDLRMVYILMRAELDGVICSGARRGKQFTYALLDERVAPMPHVSREEALVELTRRYFLSRGPATEHDFAKWSGLTVADARRGLEAARSHLHPEVIGGTKYWLPASSLPPSRPGPTAHLLSIYDEYVSGYKDRSAIVEVQDGAKLIAMGNDLTAIVLVNGHIAGTWKRTLTKRAAVIKTDLFRTLAESEYEALASAANRYGAFVGLPTTLA